MGAELKRLVSGGGLPTAIAPGGAQVPARPAGQFESMVRTALPARPESPAAPATDEQTTPAPVIREPVAQPNGPDADPVDADPVDADPVDIDHVHAGAGGSPASYDPAQLDAAQLAPAHDCPYCARIEAQLAMGGAAVAPVVPAPFAPVVPAPFAPVAPVAPIVSAPPSARSARSALPLPPPPVVRTPQPRPVTPPPSGARRRRWRVIVAVVVLCLAIAAVLIAVVSRNGHRAAAPQPAPSASAVVSVPVAPVSAQIDAAASWAGLQLPHGSELLSDAITGDALIAAGFSAVTTVSSASTATTFAFEYIVSTPALRALALTDNGLGRALTASLPVAVFGPPADQVVIRQATADSAAVVASRRQSDAQTRRTAEAELLKNPAVHATGAALAALQAGQLDLRAATVLAFLANSSQLDLVNATVDPPELAAGLPIRSVDVTIVVPVAVQTILAGLPSSYQPASITQLSNGAVRIVWPVEADPLPILN